MPARRIVNAILLLIVVALVTPTSTAFLAPSVSSPQTAATLLMAKKGFGKEAEQAPREKSAGELKREAERTRYDELSTAGQEYSIFVRQFGSDDQAWLPCGAIAVPRGGQVADAIFANEADLKTAIVRTYPRLRGYESEFEFGYNLKIYPDDPVEVASKTTPKASGFSFGNWISTLLSPIDASSVKSKTGGS